MPNTDPRAPADSRRQTLAPYWMVSVDSLLVNIFLVAGLPRLEWMVSSAPERDLHYSVTKKFGIFEFQDF